MRWTLFHTANFFLLFLVICSQSASVSKPESPLSSRIKKDVDSPQNAAVDEDSVEIGGPIMIDGLTPVCRKRRWLKATRPSRVVLVVDHNMGPEKTMRQQYLYRALICELPAKADLQIQIVHMAGGVPQVSGWQTKTTARKFLDQTIEVKAKASACDRVANSLPPNALPTDIEHDVHVIYIVDAADMEQTKNECDLRVAFQSAVYGSNYPPLKVYFDVIGIEQSTSHGIRVHLKKWDDIIMETGKEENLADVVSFGNTVQNFLRLMWKVMNHDIENEVMNVKLNTSKRDVSNDNATSINEKPLLDEELVPAVNITESGLKLNETNTTKGSDITDSSTNATASPSILMALGSENQTTITAQQFNVTQNPTVASTAGIVIVNTTNIAEATTVLNNPAVNRTAESNNNTVEPTGNLTVPLPKLDEGVVKSGNNSNTTNILARGSRYLSAEDGEDDLNSTTTAPEDQNNNTSNKPIPPLILMTDKVGETTTENADESTTVDYLSWQYLGYQGGWKWLIAIVLVFICLLALCCVCCAICRNRGPKTKKYAPLKPKADRSNRSSKSMKSSRTAPSSRSTRSDRFDVEDSSRPLVIRPPSGVSEDPYSPVSDPAEDPSASLKMSNPPDSEEVKDDTISRPRISPGGRVRSPVKHYDELNVP